jgi:hypothetical protein
LLFLPWSGWPAEKKGWTEDAPSLLSFHEKRIFINTPNFYRRKQVIRQ